MSRGLLWRCPEGLILQIVLKEEIMSRGQGLYSIFLRDHNREYEINLRIRNRKDNFHPIAGEEAREDTLSRGKKCYLFVHGLVKFYRIYNNIV